jgi:arylsulfatase A-like enzyme
LETDLQVRRLLGALQDRGALENTVVIVASDHGEQLGEHGLFNHNNSLYLPLLHVPLLIHDPRSPQAVGRVDDVISLRHVAATILNFAGVDAERSRIPGASLAEYWASPGLDGNAVRTLRKDTAFALLNRGAVDRPWYPVGWGPTMYSLVDSTHHYIRNGDGTEELYNHRIDPAEMENGAGSPDGAEVIQGFRATLRGLVGDLPPIPEGSVVHPAPPPPGESSGRRPPA